MWPHIKEFYKSPESKEDSKGDTDQSEPSEPVKVYFNCCFEVTFNAIKKSHRSRPYVVNCKL